MSVGGMVAKMSTDYRDLQIQLHLGEIPGNTDRIKCEQSRAVFPGMGRMINCYGLNRLLTLM